MTKIKLPFASMHQVEGLVDLVQGQGVGDKLIQLQLLLQVLLHQHRHTVPAFPAWYMSQNQLNAPI